MIDCKENEDGSFTISWDQNDPLESVLNDWTEKDFIEVIYNYAEEILSCKEFYSKNSSKSREESRETNISEATQKDWENFWYDSESEGKDFDTIYDNYIQAINEDTYGTSAQEPGYPTKNDRLWEG
jgi:uncharacterized protein YicC (UPF0701 family)